MGSKSRTKGKRGELELASFFKAHGVEALRGVQYKGGADSPDIILPGLPVHVECKRVERLNIHDALAQAENDAGPGDIPTVWHRRNGGEWYAALKAEDLVILLRRVFFAHPPCRLCGQRMLRWGWYENPDEPVTYWYCLECDKAGREPCIQIERR